MAAKFALVLCATALFAQSAFAIGGCGCNGLNGAGLGLNGLAGYGGAYGGAYGLGAGYGIGGGVASTGGGLPINSASPFAPVGVSVLSENCYEGSLNVGGNLPFLGTVALEGVLPTAGAGAVSYGCGNGAVSIGAEGPIATGILAPSDFAPAAGLAANGAAFGGYGAGINGYGAGLGYGAGINGYGAGLGYGAGYRNGCGCGCN